MPFINEVTGLKGKHFHDHTKLMKPVGSSIVGRFLLSFPLFGLETSAAVHHGESLAARLHVSYAFAMMSEDAHTATHSNCNYFVPQAFYLL